MRRYSGLRKRRLEGKYGLGCCGTIGVAAASGLMSAMPAPLFDAQLPSRRRSPRSPMPQLRRDRAAYNWMAHPHMRSSSGRKQVAGATMSGVDVPSGRAIS
jgi:hypothetical protein